MFALILSSVLSNPFSNVRRSPDVRARVHPRSPDGWNVIGVLRLISPHAPAQRNSGVARPNPQVRSKGCSRRAEMPLNRRDTTQHTDDNTTMTSTTETKTQYTPAQNQIPNNVELSRVSLIFRKVFVFQLLFNFLSICQLFPSHFDRTCYY